ncbi:MAG: energy-coupling factor ABC transporter ATP-binding protein [Lachnospiraceae bacterium]
MEKEKTIIMADDLSFAYDHKYSALEHLSFQIARGETIGIIGANGAGKSTLLKIMVGLLENYQGRLEIDGLTVEKKTLKEIRKKVGYVFQDSESQLFLSTVYEDVAFGPRNYGYPEETVEEKVLSALRLVHMEEHRDKQIYRLSGGQKKMAAIATVLSMEPEVILFDEPSAALDPRNRRNLVGVLNDMSCTKLIASHDMDFIKSICDRVFLLADRTIRKIGTAEEIVMDKQLLEESGL